VDVVGPRLPSAGSVTLDGAVSDAADLPGGVAVARVWEQIRDG
jgi:hypothetical protein